MLRFIAIENTAEDGEPSRDGLSADLVAKHAPNAVGQIHCPDCGAALLVVGEKVSGIGEVELDCPKCDSSRLIRL